ncbi:MAG: outer membrane protein [Xanthobacteraceae bacterium]
MSYRIVNTLLKSPRLERRSPSKRFAKGLVPIIALPVGLGSITLCAPILADSAIAADMSVKAAATRPYNWSGCYVGLNAGGGASGTSFTTAVDNGTHLLPVDAATVSATGTGSANDSNFLGGGQAGCNWQSGTLVFGLEGDVDYFHSNPGYINGTGTLSTGDPFTVTQSLTTDLFATVRPRLGVAADRNLGYITGGAAFTKTSYTQTYADALNAGLTPGTGSASGSKSLVGWTAGAGWEYAWTDNWTLRFEYLFAMFPTTSALGAITDPAGGSNTLHGSGDLVIQTTRFGVNYKF